MNTRISNRRSFAVRAVAAATLPFAVTRTGAADEHDSTMTVDETRQVIDEYVAALLEGGDFGAFLHDEVVLVVMDTGDMIEGRDAVVQGIVDWHTVAFDADPRLSRAVVDEGNAALEMLFVGTHTGGFGGVAATGMDVSVPYTAFYSFEDSLISEIRLYGLVYGLMEQLAAPDATPKASPVAASGNGNIVMVELWEFGISADPMTLAAGEEYTFMATNSGMMVHELVIEPAGVIDEPLEKGDEESEIEDIEPGDTAEMTWTFDDAGMYQFACHIPGHYELGMVLEFEVE